MMKIKNDEEEGRRREGKLRREAKFRFFLHFIFHLSPFCQVSFLYCDYFFIVVCYYL